MFALFAAQFAIGTLQLAANVRRVSEPIKNNRLREKITLVYLDLKQSNRRKTVSNRRRRRRFVGYSIEYANT